MSISKRILILACFASALFISCWESDPAGPDDEDGFKTVAGPTVTDADGNVYSSVVIGSQIWTVENLRTTKYNDGTEILHVADSVAWAELTEPGYCYYDNTTNEDWILKWGALYNWYAVNTGKLAPAGWRVPTDADWTTLRNYLIESGYNWDGSTSGNKIAKSMAAQTDWASSSSPGDPGNNPGSNNSSGFSALPGGYRDDEGTFDSQSGIGHWWSATEDDASHAHRRYLNCGFVYMFRCSSSKGWGFSVRLVQDLN